MVQDFPFPSSKPAQSVPAFLAAGDRLPVPPSTSEPFLFRRLPLGVTALASHDDWPVPLPVWTCDWLRGSRGAGGANSSVQSRGAAQPGGRSGGTLAAPRTPAGEHLLLASSPPRSALRCSFSSASPSFSPGAGAGSRRVGRRAGAGKRAAAARRWPPPGPRSET